MGCKRGGVDNFPILLFDHFSGDCLTAEKHTFEIYLHDSIPVFLFYVQKILDYNDSSIIEKNVYLTKFINHITDHGLYLTLFRHINSHAERPATVFFYHGDNFFNRCLMKIDHTDVRTFTG